MPTREEILALFEVDMENAYKEPLKSPHHYNARYFRRLLDDYKANRNSYLVNRPG